MKHFKNNIIRCFLLIAGFIMTSGCTALMDDIENPYETVDSETSGTDSETNSETDSETNSETDSETNSETDSETNSETDSETECVSGSFTQCGADDNVHGFDSCNQDEGVNINCTDNNMICFNLSDTEAECRCRNLWSGDNCEICPAGWDDSKDCSVCLPGTGSSNGKDCDLCVRYVVPDISQPATDEAMSWSTASPSIATATASAQAAILAIGGPERCEVWVSSGRLYINQTGVMDTVQMVSGVDLYGSFENGYHSRSQRNLTQLSTVLDGLSQSGTVGVLHVVTGADNARLDGFRIENGNAIKAVSDPEQGNGAGMFNVDVSPSVSNCAFINNTAENYGGAVFLKSSGSSVITDVFFENTLFAKNNSKGGGAVYNFRAHGRYKNCVFTDNTSSLNGGAIVNASSSFAYSTMNNCVLTGNTAASEGAALQEWGAKEPTTINNCIFLSNYSAVGGAITAWDGAKVFVQNSVIAANSTKTTQGAIYASYTSIELTNSTLVANVCAAINAASASTINVANSIMWDNKPDNVAGDAANWTDDSNYVGGDEPGFVGYPLEKDSKWTGAPKYNEATAKTVLTDGNANWSNGELVGLYLRANASGSKWWYIVDNTKTTITTLGDASLFVLSGDTYEIYDLNIKEDSACVDAANGDKSFVYDLLGNPRYDANKVNTGSGDPAYSDIGAYEYRATVPTEDDWYVPGCNTPSTLSNGHTYVYCNTPLSWNNASLACEQYGMHLATINTATENIFVGSLITVPAWVGASEIDIEENWQWLDGSEFNYTNWTTGAPNNQTNLSCLEFLMSGKWDESYCTQAKSYVCEYSH
ncbi:MAG: hypothetical protein JXR91_12645 [Deltaproteobacteria bacterium]|nr:hypothetical protein [Deltaproteobacteria bacterium]